MERKVRKETVSPLHISTKNRSFDPLPRISQYEEEASSRTRDDPPPNADANRHGRHRPINLTTLLRAVNTHRDEHGYFQPLPNTIEILSSDEEYSPTEDEGE
jgi:hypothetical protein